MIFDSRQKYFGLVKVPEINRAEEVKLSDYLEHIKNILFNALTKIYNIEYNEDKVKDSISQSINFLVGIGAIKEKEDVREEIVKLLKEEKLVLWKEFVELQPIYEGINSQLKTMLIKHHYPQMYTGIMKGEIYSHYGLTIIKESVSYTLEFLKKENLLLDESELIKRKEVKNWIGEKNG
jgi:hypothetical protein